jgi:hypothetical protein
MNAAHVRAEAATSTRNGATVDFADFAIATQPDGFAGPAGVGGMSKGPVRSACMGMLADIARPESNGEVTNVIFLAIFLAFCKR